MILDDHVLDELPADAAASVESFRSFLSWGVHPRSVVRPVPPAWFAYALGLTQYCPPRGTL